MKKAFITGIAGQDGSYLTELLLAKGYEVSGLVRELPNKSNGQKFFRINHLLSSIKLYKGDIVNTEVLRKIIRETRPDEVYDLAAIADPLVTFESEFGILHNNLSGIHGMLGAIKEFSPATKLYFAASSLVFGNPITSPQDEETSKNPITPYGIAKTAGCNLVGMYREVYGIYACCGILYNHESPRRGEGFLPGKISNAVARIKNGLQDELVLGDINAKRDWGYVGDFVESMWLMLQQDRAEDFVIGTGEVHSVKDLLEVAFGVVGLDWKIYVKIDQKLVRKEEQTILVANPVKAKMKLGWEAKVPFVELIEMMVKKELSKFDVKPEDA